MIINSITHGFVEADSFSINKAELSARLKNPIITEEIEGLINKYNSVATYRYAYVKMPVSVDGNECIFDCGTVKSNSLSKVLNGCNEAVLFAVTTGIEADRLLKRYTLKSNSEAFLLDAIGSAMIESFADYVNELIVKDLNVTKRFSPGYADFPLEFQKILLKTINAESTLGISISENLFMTPVKSITAVIGIY